MPKTPDQDGQLNIPAFLLNPIASRVEERDTRPASERAAHPVQRKRRPKRTPDEPVAEEALAASNEELAEVQADAELDNHTAPDSRTVQDANLTQLAAQDADDGQPAPTDDARANATGTDSPDDEAIIEDDRGRTDEADADEDTEKPADEADADEDTEKPADDGEAFEDAEENSDGTDAGNCLEESVSEPVTDLDTEEPAHDSNADEASDVPAAKEPTNEADAEAEAEESLGVANVEEGPIGETGTEEVVVAAVGNAAAEEVVEESADKTCAEEVVVASLGETEAEEPADEGQAEAEAEEPADEADTADAAEDSTDEQEDAETSDTEDADPQSQKGQQGAARAKSPRRARPLSESGSVRVLQPEPEPLDAPSPEDEVDAMMQSVMLAVRGSKPSESDEVGEPEDAAPTDVEADAELVVEEDLLDDEPTDAQADAADDEPSPQAEPSDEQEGADTAQPDQLDTPEPDGPVPTIEEDLQTMARLERRLFAHRYASAELETFGSSIDPARATADRSEALVVLAEEDHELLCAPGIDEALDRLQSRAEELPPLLATQVNVLAKDRHRVVSVPAQLHSELVRLTAESYDAWVHARQEDSWASFAPYLDQLVDLKRQIALAQDGDAHPYDTMLDEFEPGTNRAFYNSFFARIKQSIVPLLSSISMSARRLNRACVQGHFDERRQWDLALDICDLMGIDKDAHYLTSTVHPFSQAMTSNYAITAAHVDGDDLMANVYTMLHELGHNLYEQGVNPAFNRTSLKGGTSSGMHEAQSRFFENCVGRDRAFMRPLLELMRRRFPGQLSRVTPNQLYQAVNCVEPSLIRINADELSYPLHILVRYEIEQLLVSGEAKAADVPALWAERYERYLGARPSSDADGALQDVHWAMGEFGYFPSYALGNAYAAQLRAKMIDEGMDWDALLREGDLAPIRDWLKDRIWQYGRSKEPRQLIEEACGEPFSPRHYANYLTNKYVALYGLGRG